MKKMVVFLSLILVSTTSFAKDRSLLCLATGEIDQSSPIEDSGAILSVRATLTDNLILNQLRMDEFPFSNDSEEIFSQDKAEGRLNKGVAYVYLLSNEQTLIFPENFQNMKKFNGTLLGLQNGQERELFMQCEITKN